MGCGSTHWPSTSLLMSLVSVVAGLVGTFNRDDQVIGLVSGQFGQIDGQSWQVSHCYFFVQFFVQHENSNLVFARVSPQVNLSQNCPLTNPITWASLLKVPTSPATTDTKLIKGDVDGQWVEPQPFYNWKDLELMRFMPEF